MASRDWPTKGEMVVMRILQDAPKGLYGLQIVAESDKAISRGSIYVLLSRLQEKGYVKSRRPQSDPDYPGLPRPIYTLSAEGSRVLAFADQLGVNVAGART